MLQYQRIMLMLCLSLCGCIATPLNHEKGTRMFPNPPVEPDPSPIGTLSPIQQKGANSSKPELKAYFEGPIIYGKMSGSVKINLQNGEVLDGKYIFIPNGKEGLGQLYNQLNGNRGIKHEGILTYAIGGGWGEINMVGTAKSTLRCEYYYNFNKNMNGKSVGGDGVCQDSEKQLYRLKF